jgi:hypothetical protein
LVLDEKVSAASQTPKNKTAVGASKAKGIAEYMFVRMLAGGVRHHI